MLGGSGARRAHRRESCARKRPRQPRAGRQPPPRARCPARRTRVPPGRAAASPQRAPVRGRRHRDRSLSAATRRSTPLHAEPSPGAHGRAPRARARAGCLGQEPQRITEHETRKRRRGQREQHLERRGRSEPERWNHPGMEQLRVVGARILVSSQKLGGVLRAVIERRQHEIELPLVLHLFSERDAEGAERPSQVLCVGRERMRARLRPRRTTPAPLRSPGREDGVLPPHAELRVTRPDGVQSDHPDILACRADVPREQGPGSERDVQRPAPFNPAHLSRLVSSRPR
jgi:hypothetical protein